MSTVGLAVPAVSSAPTRPSSDGPDMSERIAFGAAHETQGRRTKVSTDVTLSLIEPMIFCWRRARVRSDSLRVALVLARAGERERLLAVDLLLAALQPQRVAAVLEAAVERETTQPPR